MPTALVKYKSAFRKNSMCFYTGNHGGKEQDMCADGNGHAWRTAIQNRHYMCAKVTGTWNDDKSSVRRTWDNVKLGTFNGIKATIYSFKEMTYKGFHDDDYSLSSIRGCKQNGAGWKPVCEHGSWCKNDKQSIYLGQKGELSSGSSWSTSNVPRGLKERKKDEILKIVMGRAR